MTIFWQIVAIVGGVLFIVILFSMVKTSNQTRENVIQDTEQRFHGISDVAVFTTNKGTFSVALEKEKAPRTTLNFIKLAKEGFYDGQRFHRVIDGFMIQGGDPLSKDESRKSMWGTGGPGYSFEDEFHPELSNVFGSISMANSGPNTNGSQFFINVGDNNFLDNKHAVFGLVVSGIDVVLEISKTKTDERDRPIEDVIIEKIEIR